MQEEFSFYRCVASLAQEQRNAFSCYLIITKNEIYYNEGKRIVIIIGKRLCQPCSNTQKH